MPSGNPELNKVLDFILNRARDGELDAIRMALERRIGPQPGVQGAGQLDFHEMARRTMEGYSDRFGADADIHGMTRRLVANMILEREPGIDEVTLEKLLDQYVPSPGQSEARMKASPPPEASAIPKDVIASMLDQFLRYSIGKMPDSEARELKQSMPDWAERYWTYFPENVRPLVLEVIRRNKSLNQFWKEIERLL